MLNFIKKNAYILLVSLIALCFAILSAFSLFGGAVPSTYYQTGELEDSSAFNSVCFKVKMDDGVDLDTVWINLGSIDYVKDQGETLSIYTSIARTSSLS
ncbi:MAG: hypothetical protein SPL13_03185, partial [Clostridia bacterium]|nr:hypothetical protein [Clostridia bacterium]